MAGDLFEFLADGGRSGDLGLQSGFEGRIRDRDDLAVGLAQGLRADERGTMLDALKTEDIVRKDLCLDLGFVDPEVGITVQFAKSDLILAFVTGVISRRASTDTALGELADDRAAVVDLRDRDLRGPEHRDPVEYDQGQQANDHAEADDEAEAGEPDPRFTAGGTAIGVGSDHDLDDFIALTQALAENFREGVNHEGEQKETASPEEERTKVGVADGGLR